MYRAQCKRKTQGPLLKNEAFQDGESRAWDPSQHRLHIQGPGLPGASAESGVTFGRHGAQCHQCPAQAGYSEESVNDWK